MAEQQSGLFLPADSPFHPNKTTSKMLLLLRPPTTYSTMARHFELIIILVCTMASTCHMGDTSWVLVHPLSSPPWLGFLKLICIQVCKLTLTASWSDVVQDCQKGIHCISPPSAVGISSSSIEASCTCSKVKLKSPTLVGDLSLWRLAERQMQSLLSF